LTTAKASTPVRPNFTLPNTRLLLVVVRPAMPVPVRATLCGLVVALSVSESDAGIAPVAEGEKETASVHVVKGATVIGIPPQVPVPFTAYSGSDEIALETISG